MNDEVRDLLGTATLERIIAMRGHTDMGCIVCGGEISPQDREPVSVTVRRATYGRRPVRTTVHDTS